MSGELSGTYLATTVRICPFVLFLSWEQERIAKTLTKLLIVHVSGSCTNFVILRNVHLIIEISMAA